jgi:glycosyltransferase involved in cell wall biosynthesis
MEKTSISIKNKTVYILVPAYDGSGPTRGALSLAELLHEQHNVCIVFCGLRKINFTIKSTVEIIEQPNYFSAFKYLINNIHSTDNVISYCIKPDLLNMSLKIFRHHSVVCSIRAIHKNVYADIYGVIIGNILTVLHNHSLYFSDKIISMSDEMSKSLPNHCQKKLVKIMNFDLSPDRYQRPVYNEKKGKTFIIVSRLTRGKVDEGIFKFVHELDFEVDQFLVFGVGSESENLERIANKYFDGRVKFMGWDDNPWATKYVNPVLVHFSSAEGFPRSIIEASMCGIPVVGLSIPGSREYANIFKNLNFFDDNNRKSVLAAKKFISSYEYTKVNHDYLVNINYKYTQLLKYV